MARETLDPETTTLEDLERMSTIDGRDLIRLHEALKDIRDAHDEWDGATEEERGDEPEALSEDQREVLDALEPVMHDVDRDATLINDNYFTDYAKDLAEDIGAVGSNMQWPLNHIDWDAAADALKADYTTVDIGGATFHIRD